MAHKAGWPASLSFLSFPPASISNYRFPVRASTSIDQTFFKMAEMFETFQNVTELF